MACTGSGGSRPPRAANRNRARWREKCRQLLANHIQQELGLNIGPAEVRLIPGLDSAYQWDYPREQSHLFRKQISKHTIGAYKALRDNVGLSIKAIHCDGPSASNGRREDVGAVPAFLSGTPSIGDEDSSGDIRVDRGDFGPTVAEILRKNDLLSAALSATKSLVEDRDGHIRALSQRNEHLQSQLRQLQAKLRQQASGNTQGIRRLRECVWRNAVLAISLKKWKAHFSALQEEIDVLMEN